MNELSRLLTTDDLACIVDFLIPGCKEKSRMLRALREDEELLFSMLGDKRMVDRLTRTPDTLLNVSPVLLFTSLLLKVKQDLEQHPYTVEQESHRSLFVFDSNEILGFLNDRNVMVYLIEMLCSFIRINSFAVLIQVRRGVWERFTFSDFDIDSLIRYSELVDEEARFFSYKRIADICLFMTGIFPSQFGVRNSSTSAGHRGLRSAARRGREELRRFGVHFYKQAGEHRSAGASHLDRVLFTLSERFLQAEKPLLHMSRFYLGFIKDQLFLH
jgi:hypothetical protein